MMRNNQALYYLPIYQSTFQTEIDCTAGIQVRFTSHLPVRQQKWQGSLRGQGQQILLRCWDNGVCLRTKSSSKTKCSPVKCSTHLRSIAGNTPWKLLAPVNSRQFNWLGGIVLQQSTTKHTAKTMTHAPWQTTVKQLPIASAVLVNKHIHIKLRVCGEATQTWRTLMLPKKSTIGRGAGEMACWPQACSHTHTCPLRKQTYWGTAMKAVSARKTLALTSCQAKQKQKREAHDQEKDTETQPQGVCSGITDKLTTVMIPLFNKCTVALALDKQDVTGLPYF